MGDLRNRFPDLTDKNFDLVPVHSSMSDIDPVAGFVRQRFVLAPVEDGGEAALLVSVILKLDLPHTIRQVQLLSLQSFAKITWSCKQGCISYADQLESFVPATTMGWSCAVTGKSEYTKVTSLCVGWIPVSHGPREWASLEGCPLSPGR